MGRRRDGHWDDDDWESDEYGFGGFGSSGRRGRYSDYYPESTPRRVEGGLKAKSERGAIGETWWSKRWVQALERLNLGARLTRGRSYARQGQVISIDIEPGMVQAKVQGSAPRPYKVSIGLRPLSDHEWELVMDALAAQALFAAKLLAGEMPATIEEVFQAVHVPLFPTATKDLQTDCSCPDWSNPCKHIAAVYYILAERFDEDPFLLFKLRGRSKETIIETLRQKRAATLSPDEAGSESAAEAAEPEPEVVLRLEEFIDSFWQAGEGLDAFTVNPGVPDVDKAVLKRLGPAPHVVNGQNLSTLLAQVYDVVARAVQRKAAEE